MEDLTRTIRVFRSNWQILVPVIIVIVFLIVEHAMNRHENPHWLWVIFGALALGLISGGAYFRRHGVIVVGAGLGVVAVVLLLNVGGAAFWLWTLVAFVIVIAGILLARE
jgi:hypothetical protein